AYASRHAGRSNTRKRTFRCCTAPLQARVREGRRAHGAAPPRVLRETYARAQAQEGCRREAAPEANVTRHDDDEAPPTLLAAAHRKRSISRSCRSRNVSLKTCKRR